MPRARKRHEPDVDQDDVGTLAHPNPGLSSSPSIYTFSTEMQIDVTPMPTTSFNLTTLNQLQLDRPQHPSTSYSGPNSTATLASTSTSTATCSTVTTHPYMPPTRTSHGKKRDASYIPRPPNAFILFRSSFIRSERVPGNVEGNHSTLSKIIGKCWKALSPEEKERWEREAVIAQAEHRKKYPDWRFMPGANAAATAKSRVQVKEGAGSPMRRKRLVNVLGKEKYKRGSEDGEDDDDEYQESGMKDGMVNKTRDKGKARAKSDAKATAKDRRKDKGKYATREKGRGKEKGKEKGQGLEEDEERLAKIAELLVEGVKGRDLHKAIEEWEETRKRKRKRSNRVPGGRDEGESSRSRRRTEDRVDPEEEDDGEMDELDAELDPDLDADVDAEAELEAESTKNSKGWRDSNSPSSSNFSTTVYDPSTEFSKIPLTHMFKRERTDSELAAFSTGNAGNTGSNAGSAAGSTGDEDCQEPWWTTTAAAFEADTTGLGYDPAHIVSLGQGFHIDNSGKDDQDGSPIPGSDAINWTSTKGGLLAAIVDPFLNSNGETCAIGMGDVNEKRLDCPEVSSIAPAASVPLSSSVSAPCPGSSGIGPCSCPITPLPLTSIASMSPLSALPCTSASSLPTATAAATSQTATNRPASAETAENAQQVPPLLYSRPCVVDTQQPHFSTTYSQTQSHSQLHHPHSHHHHTRSFSSLADWDGAASAGQNPIHSSLPHVPMDQGQIPISVHGLNPGANETKHNGYGIDESAYNLRYYGAPSDWPTSYR